eukprot:scaffold122320_cov21-Tisochrysis_lutea.AAC.1
MQGRKAVCIKEGYPDKQASKGLTKNVQDVSYGRHALCDAAGQHAFMHVLLQQQRNLNIFTH